MTEAEAQRSPTQQFTERFVAATRALRIGPNLTYDADLGSLIGAAQLARVESHVDQAVALGATVLTGGRARPDIGPYFYEPTVLSGVTTRMLVTREETFGPVVAVQRVEDDAHALAIARRCTLPPVVGNYAPATAVLPFHFDLE